MSPSSCSRSCRSCSSSPRCRSNFWEEAEMHGLHLAHDLLDAQLMDRRGERIGRVDELVLELREGEPARVVAILVGGTPRAERIGHWMVWLRRLWHRSSHDHTSRIPF